MEGVIRIRLDFAYQGTGFAGWAVQPGLRTVQGTLEAALERVLRVPAPRLTVAGRTDSGVHSRGQVAHLDLDVDVWEKLPSRSGRTPGNSLVSRLAGVLPRDIVVHRASRAPAGFDARYSATMRRYSYRIADSASSRDPLRRDWTLWVKKPLDVAAMHEACQPLLGVRDFAAFCRPRPGATTIRHLQELTWARPESGPDAGLVVASLRSDAFCHNMVRALVGASLTVGEGRAAVGWPSLVLARGMRDSRAPVIAPEGLVLEEVVYPPDDELAARATLGRNRRTDEDVWADEEDTLERAREDVRA